MCVICTLWTQKHSLGCTEVDREAVLRVSGPERVARVSGLSAQKHWPGHHFVTLSGD